jgi:hypothetical protein
MIKKVTTNIHIIKTIIVIVKIKHKNKTKHTYNNKYIKTDITYESPLIAAS